MRKSYSLIIVIVSTLLPFASFAQVSIASAIVAFQSGGKPFLDVGVSNSSEKPIYAVSELVRIKDPANKDSEVEETDDILVSPKRISIGPKSSRTVRLLLRKGLSDEERVYRLVFNPQDKLPEPDGTAETEAQRKQAVLRVVTTVGMLAFVEPKVLNVDFNWTFEGSKVIFKNNGNIHMRLYAPLLCPDDQKGKGSEVEVEKCKKIDSFRVYPGHSREVEIEPGYFLRFQKRIGEEKEVAIEEISIPKH
ncbi:MAG: molecular chaperone [SAR324 cluster bacterium]|uniref:Molecular chaperone n=1 Tax=SAR324 cluster bacterium TaxID=2024889 RepID=A0A7X9FTF2_9DELT|nr:molecular chaperone [SAR324 cluster bacterium]